MKLFIFSIGMLLAFIIGTIISQHDMSHRIIDKEFEWSGKQYVIIEITSHSEKKVEENADGS